MATEKEMERRKFTVQLNGSRDLHEQLEKFKSDCEAHEKQRHKRCKRRYYQMGLMARIVEATANDEIHRLLLNGARTFLFETSTNKPDKLQDMIARTKEVIAKFEVEQQPPLERYVFGLALEITGDSCRFGRMRNDCSVLLARGELITLTADESYRYSSYKEIAYVINLRHYMTTLHLNDELTLGLEVRGIVVRCRKDNVIVLIKNPGLLNSYEYIGLPQQCYALPQDKIPQLYHDDLNKAALVGANYVVITHIRCKRFVKTLRAALPQYGGQFRLIGSIDLAYISANMLDLMGIVKLLDYLWIPDMFTASENISDYVNQDVVPMAKCLKKPIIGTIPLQCCTDFKSYENHNFLWKIDAMFIEKSSWCNKYPLIVKKLLPLLHYRMAAVENCLTLKSVLESYQSIVNFIIRTISSIECQAIILHSKCESAAAALARVEIYCAVYVVMLLDEEADPESFNCQINFARSFNLRRNLRSIVYTKELNECNYEPIEYAMHYTRKMGMLQTGDFIITLEVCMTGEAGNDAIILRAFYMPPANH